MADTLKKAVDLLARREHSSQELLNKLSQKGFALNEIRATLLRLQSNGLLSDERFAESYVHRRAKAGFGPKRIVMELKVRGVDESLSDQIIGNSDIDWEANCRFAWEKKYNQHEPYGSEAYLKQFRFLIQRGYLQEMIDKILR